MECQQISNKVLKRGKSLSLDQKAIYYSHWAYTAIHMMVSIPELSTSEQIRKYLNLPEIFVDEILKFLIESELIEFVSNRYKIGKTRIHLEKSSPFVRALHSNWRQKAIESLVTDDDLNLHYSSVLTLSAMDSIKIKQLILNLIKEKEKILLPSTNEQIVIYNVDFFKL